MDPGVGGEATPLRLVGPAEEPAPALFPVV